MPPLAVPLACPMEPTDPIKDPGDAPAERATPGPIIYRSEDLLHGRREVWIEHGDQMYRLRVTSSDKLYLTK